MRRVLKAVALITTLAVLAAAFCACNMLKVKDSPTRPDGEGDGSQGTSLPNEDGSQGPSAPDEDVSSPEFTLSFDTDGGSAVPVVRLAAGAALTAPEDPSKEGYTFADWFLGNAGEPYSFTTMPEENLTLTAHWTANSYTISLDALGGTSVQEKEVEYGTEFTLDVSSRTGYEFAGWKTKAGLALTSASGEGLSRWNIASDVELQAIWTPIEYSITYNDLSDTSHDNPAKYTIETETITLRDPGPRLHYDFAGWQLADGSPITEIPQGSTGSLEIHAAWVLHDYVITYENLLGSTHSNPGKYNIEGSDIVLTAPTDRTGYDFTGWYDSETGGRKVTEIMPGSDGEKYRGVYFTQYRPYYCGGSSSNTYQDDNGYNPSTVYWFKYEPIKWRILNEADGTALILCEMAIDSQQWDYKGGSNYKNNYAESTIRAWLNNTFYNTAFNDAQKVMIQTTAVDNSVSSTGYDPNEYACENTDDKIFLLSYAEATNAAYGLNTDAARQKISTDYAKAQGCYTSTDSSYPGNCYWWLRSPHYDYDNYARNVSSDGDFIHNYVYRTSRGVVPALTISLSDTTAYTRVNADGRPDANGGYILFGEYPQTKVTDSAVLSVLGDFDSNDWTSCGYMTYSDKTAVVDRTLYAGWNLLEYSISYENTEGREHSNPAGYTYESETILLSDLPVPYGYAFAGWYDSPSGGTRVTEIPQGSTGDITLYARREPAEYIITYENLYGTTHTNSPTYNIESADMVLTAPAERPGYTFDGWYDAPEGGCRVREIIPGAIDRYRGVYFTQYRPYWCGSSSSSTYQDDNGYNPSTVYWFKYEPIKWRILNESGGKALILCDMAIDSQQFDYEAGDEMNGHNNYKESTIRTWLNGTFYYTAFSSLQKELIQTTTNTNDKIFLLSYKEATNAAYGLNTDAARQKISTDYAKAQGCYASTNSGYLGNCFWWLRSPDYDHDDRARIVNCDGGFDEYDVDRTSNGVVPALTISLSDPSAYKRVDADGTPNASGEYILFGKYPQTKAMSSKLLSELGDFDPDTWTSYGYYISKNRSNFMKYTDKEVDGIGDLTLYARWKIREYSIAYENLHSGTNPNPSNYTIYTETIMLQDPEAAGYDFVEWQLADGTVITEIPQGSAKDLEIHAIWTPIVYNITYENTNGGEHSNPATYTCEDDTIVLADLAADAGYAFGWYDAETGGNKVTRILHGSVGDKTLYARWTPIQYSVTYVLNGGTNDPANPSVYTIENLGSADGTLPLEAPEKIAKKETGDYLGNGLYELFVHKYTFVGWYTDSAFTNKVTKLSLSIGTVTLYAKWGTDTFVTASTVPVYRRINANGTANASGSYILFGEYPQTKVTNSALLSALGNYSSNTWTSYGYYISGSVNSFMQYTDKEYDGEKYRGVHFTQYRPYICTYGSFADYSSQDNNGYYTSTVYWFKYEPIKWRILNETDGKALILCETAIDSQQFDYRADKTYKNNYKESTIRKWLNETFYNTAFSNLQKALIQTTTVDNSVSSTGDAENQYACANTNDKIFLLSKKEATNAVYGFDSDYSQSDAARQKKSTDYAKSQGCSASTSSSYLGNCQWWLRSPSHANDDYARHVNCAGDSRDDWLVNDADFGVVPALTISL